MKGFQRIKDNLWVFGLTVLFLVLLSWIILFKMSFSLAELSRLRGINLIPFYYEEETPYHVREVILNVLAFIPLGVYLKLLKFEYWEAVLLGFGYSLLLEILQFVLEVGITDITDLMTNTSGVLIGLMGYAGLSAIFRNARMLDKALCILATIGTTVLAALMFLLLLAN